MMTMFNENVDGVTICLNGMEELRDTKTSAQQLNSEKQYNQRKSKIAFNTAIVVTDIQCFAQFIA